jgi:hypothetical protein
LLGEVYTRDTIEMTDMNNSSEEYVIIAGSTQLVNTKGAIRVNSYPTFLNDGVHVNIAEITGSVCIPE